MRTVLPLAVVGLLAAASSAGAAGPPDPVRVAVERGLRRLEQGSGNYVKNSQCFSCHHQAVTIAALASARRRGLAIDEERFKEQTEFTLKTFTPKLEKIRQGQSVPGASTTAAYALYTLAAAGHPSDDTTDALVDFLLARQKADGSWPGQANRPPSEGSSFTTAGLVLPALARYKPLGDGEEASKKREQLDQAAEKGRDWLLKNKPVTTEDMAFQLRGLVAAKAPGEMIDEARERLLKAQREDGGWGQLPDLPSDAYATGTVLMALRAAGVSPRGEAYQRGVRHLLRTQREDGAWVVETRSRPVQIFFDNGDPGGKSQFISFAATGWAALALLECLAER